MRQASRDFNVRHVLVPGVFVKYADAPQVMAYYRKAFRKEPDIVYSDASSVSIWNEEFLEPLVEGCEKRKWHYFSMLSSHSVEWREKPAYVARISAAFLKRHPILQREVRTIPDGQLEEWAKAVVEAGAVADPALVELLRPASADKRQAWINYGVGGWTNRLIEASAHTARCGDHRCEFGEVMELRRSIDRMTCSYQRMQRTYQPAS